MTDQSTPWRDVAADLPSRNTIVLVSTVRGAVQLMWLTPGGGWQLIHPAESMPLTRRKPRAVVPDPPAHWMPIPPPPWDPTRTQRMISIYRCRLVNERWDRIERYHVDRSFASMAEGFDFAEALNARTWPRFDWLLGPVEAFLAMRAKDRFSTCEVDVGGGASEQK